MLASVVDPGSLASPGMRNSALQQQSAKQRVNRPQLEWPSAGSREEGRIGLAILKVGSVLSQALHEGQSRAEPTDLCAPFLGER
jgi:hypothetical protein